MKGPTSLRKEVVGAAVLIDEALLPIVRNHTLTSSLFLPVLFPFSPLCDM